MICTLHKDHPENTEMAPAMLLEHFLNCIDRQRQEDLLAELRTQAQAGNRCLMANHDGVIRSQATYTAKLLTGIRSLLDRVEQPPTMSIGPIRDQLREILGLDS